MRKANLMLHAGAANVSREQVDASATPPSTDTWFPIAHNVLLDRVHLAIAGMGLQVVNEAHGLTKDGKRYFGLIQLGNGGEDGQFGLVAGIRNSHDKTFPAAIVLGAQVFVCDNLSFSGEIKLARKHTTNIMRDLPGLVTRAVGRLGELRDVQDRRFLAYENTELTDVQAHDLAIRAVDAQILPVTRIPDFLREWRAPSHPEFAQRRNIWRLFNAATEILKGNIGLLPERTMGLHGLMDSACGLVIESPTAARVVEPETVLAN